MTPFTLFSGTAALIAIDNIDTDQLIPARFMKRPRSEGYGAFLLHDLRHSDNNPAQHLDTASGRSATIMVSGRNFGCGSSREASVYALADFGIRCVIASSFGDIFASNAIKNGVLPARVTSKCLDQLHALLEKKDTRNMTIDLPDQCIRIGNETFTFEIEAVWKTQLVNGWDDIDMTRSYQNEIDHFIRADKQARPWATPNKI